MNPRPNGEGRAGLCDARREKYFRWRKNFDDAKIEKKSSGRCDRFRQQIVEIGVILAIFEPFEI